MKKAFFLISFCFLMLIAKSQAFVNANISFEKSSNRIVINPNNTNTSIVKVDMLTTDRTDFKGLNAVGKYKVVSYTIGCNVNGNFIEFKVDGSIGVTANQLNYITKTRRMFFEQIIIRKGRKRFKIHPFTVDLKVPAAVE